MSEEQAAAKTNGPRCLIRSYGCPSPHEQEAARYALAMDSALRHVRLLAAAAGGGMIPAEAVLRAVDAPYRFPLPGDAEALDAYRKVYEDGNRAIAHLAECGRCEPVGYDRVHCQGYYAAVRADAEEERQAGAERSPETLAKREESLRAAGVPEGTIRMMRP